MMPASTVSPVDQPAPGERSYSLDIRKMMKNIGTLNKAGMMQSCSALRRGRVSRGLLLAVVGRPAAPRNGNRAQNSLWVNRHPSCIDVNVPKCSYVISYAPFMS